MKDKNIFRLVSIGFLSGVVFSGLVFITLNLTLNHRNQNEIVKINSRQVVETITDSPFTVIEKINLNQATLNQLVTLPGIGEAKARAIIDFREKYGDFENVSELTYVSGIGNTLIKSIEDMVIIN
ncbi:MAG: hypothetical protein CVU42_02400 [Chloroflexi bacterium HGW-Chloroflexi-4]|jgi:competence protein ComEA|nr:MAG: hypothetical protein CVU42_02400 [Chloroflexi bacterium HGW-Chloroflexi-4]